MNLLKVFNGLHAYTVLPQPQTQTQPRSGTRREYMQSTYNYIIMVGPVGSYPTI